MKVEMISLDRIKPYDKNPRVNDEAVSKVAESIEQFGFQQPIVVNLDGVIIVGHTRFRAAKLLKLKEVPVCVADLPEDKERAYRIADNKTNEFARWDYNLLKGELKDLNAVDLDFELGDLGIDFGELSYTPPAPSVPGLGSGINTPPAANFTMEEDEPDRSHANTLPEIDTREVTDKNIERAENRMGVGEARMDRIMIEAICPECGAEFNVSPQKG